MQGIFLKPWKQKAIRESPLGRLWQTRRLDHLKEINQSPNDYFWSGAYFYHEDGKEISIKPPYRVGEMVYIKEAWATYSGFDSWNPREIYTTAKVWYPLGGDLMNIPMWVGKFRSPLFMPSWAARDFLKITDVRPERLQEITFEDCLAEGIVHTEQWQKVDYQAPESLHPDDLSNEEADKEISRGWEQYTRQAYSMLWDSINKTYSFDSNPWCFVYTFELVTDGGDSKRRSNEDVSQRD